MNPEHLVDLERTMALLIFPPESLTPPLAELLQPSLRQKVAKEVNEALLKGGGRKPHATLYDLINHRAWVHQKAQRERKDSVPNNIDLGLDPIKNGGAIGKGNGSRAATDQEGDVMATGWDGQS